MTEPSSHGTVGSVLGRPRRGGDGFILCACGRRHWGRFGAAGLLVQRGTQVLMQHRAMWSHEGGTWAVPGGALDVGESPLDAALREAAEEAGVSASAVRPRHSWTIDHGTWAYTTVITEAVGSIDPQRLDGESEELRWVAVTDVTTLPLHSGFAAGWPSVAPLLARHEVIVVDVANVVGSVPDGWWRDRAGASQRLVDALCRLAASGLIAGTGVLSDVPGRSRGWPDWVAVVEGAARGVSAGNGAVRVVAAPGSGDDTIVSVVDEQVRRGREVTVVTADRALRARVSELGARVAGPRALTSLLG
jgi:8-oxo-dGTP pyrophosphatase MutT (NUDIX family)